MIYQVVNQRTEIIAIATSSSVARGGGGGAKAPPIGMSNKMRKEKNTTFLALLRLFYVLDGLKSDLKTSFETYIQGGGG